MITAIGVAAIPVPENRASAPGEVMRIAAEDVHNDDLDEYRFEDTGHSINPSKTIKYNDAYDGKLASELVEYLDTSVWASYNVIDLGTTSSGTKDYRLSWQFMYYTVQNPNESGQGGVVCTYNSSFITDTVSLPLYPNTKYFVVEAEDVTNYFNAENWDEMAGYKGTNLSVKMDNMNVEINPNVPVTYSYEDYTSDADVDPFLQEYFSAELEEKRKTFATYEDALSKSPDTAGTKPQKLSKTPTIDLTDMTLKLQYFAEHCKSLQDAGKGYSLVPAHDGRPKQSHDEDGGMIYLAQGGTPQGTSTKDEMGFLVLEQSRVNMIAIGKRAFKDVNNVENMSFSNQIAFIGDEAFLNAGMLKSVQLVNVSDIGNGAFKGCNNLTNVDLGNATDTIGAYCFSGTQISQISFGSTLKEIGYGAFANCASLKEISFVNNIQNCKIDDYAFYNCSALTSVSMSDAGITELGDGVFATSSGAQPMGFILPKGLSNSDGIGNYLFAGRAALEYVVFPQDFGRVARPEATIKDSVFHGCVNLQYVEFPCNPQNDPTACGFVKFDSEKLFADVINPDFYVRGPEKSQDGQTALPRQCTWKAKKSASVDPRTIPYVYTKDGKDYYEVSDGTYLMCIDNQGMLTSCTLAPDADLTDWEGKVVIPSMVGKTKVVGIAPGCFSDSNLNEEVVSLVIEDDSITSIGDGVFQGGGGDNKKDWQKLEKVYVGNSVTSVGTNAFKDCTKLTDVTFATPSAGYAAFQIGADAFKTGSKQLTFHGDIVEGYAPFEWATDPETIIQPEGSIRVCYKSPLPTLLTVMYNPITDMVTLLDYPKYNEIDELLYQEYADEIKTSGKDNYNDWREMTFYTQYSDPFYDGSRYDFAQKWKAAGGDSDAEEALYSDGSYGPWITDNFCTFMSGGHLDEWLEEYGKDTQKDWQNKEETWSAKADTIADFFFEPIVAYAADAPDDYYKHYPFIVTQAVDSDNPYWPTTPEESLLVYNTKNLDIPAGIDSIDAYGYACDLTVDGEKNESVAASNQQNKATYFFPGTNGSRWTTESYDMYYGIKGANEDDPDTDIVPGLFSGMIVDGETSSHGETHKRGNDVIRSVTMHSVKYLPDYAFDSCEGLEYVILGDDCADIGVAPFRGCYAMTLVGGNDYYSSDNGIIYSNNTDGSYTIEECLAGRGRAVGPGSVNVLSDENIKNVSAIKPGAFEDCDFLTEVNFGSSDTAGLQEIPEDCFRNCDILSKVTLPMTVNDIGPNAFVGANSLNELVVYGKEVKISGRAFRNEKDESGRDERARTTVRAYEDSAVARYVKEYGDEYNLFMDEVNPLGEIWQVSFYDPNYVLIEDLKDQSGNPLDNPQYVEDGARATEPAAPVMEGWTFERWVGSNNVDLGKPIHEDSFFYAQGFSESGMVNGKYPVEFYDGVDGKQVGPTQYIDPGKDAIAPGHPVHTGYEADGYSDTYTNIQMAKTIVLKYKAVSTSGSSTGGTQTPGNTSNRTSSSNNTTSNTSNTSTTSSSTGSTSASTIGMHVVTVNGGSGSGTYATGATVQITANTPAAGSVFSKWTTTSQGVSLANVSATPTTFSMPANDVVITAEFTAAAAPVANTGSNAVNTNNNDNGSTRVDITKPGISNKGLASANVNGSTDNFVIKITETDEATNAVREALTNKYGSLDNILYYAMDISLYDSTGTVKLTDTSGITVDITIPIPDALVTYGGNNMAGAVINGNQLENLNENFTTINGVPCIRFTATHFSPYTVYVDTGNLTEGMLDTTPKTGDPIHPKWFLSIGLACLSVILFMKKDKGAKVKTA